MGRRNKNYDVESGILNSVTYQQYVDRLTELSLSMFKWTNLPETVDARFMEITLFSRGQAVFFNDEVLGFLVLNVTAQGRLNIYRIPIKRRAYADNGYSKKLDINDSVIIYNNLLRRPTEQYVRMYAERLYNIERTIDVNINAQKTPILLQCSEEQKLTLENIYSQYSGNKPVIFGTKSLDINGVKSLTTNAPYVSDKLYQLKMQIWNEALTYLGISNINVVKKERMITDEVTRNQGGVIASRHSRLESRRTACEKINEMFGLDIWCDYREDFQDIAEATSETLERGEEIG